MSYCHSLHYKKNNKKKNIQKYWNSLKKKDKIHGNYRKGFFPPPTHPPVINMHTDGKNKTHNRLKHKTCTTELELHLLINLTAFSSTFGLKIIFKKRTILFPPGCLTALEINHLLNKIHKFVIFQSRYGA